MQAGRSALSARFFMLHMAERELRKLVGEHESIVGWPTPQRMIELRGRVSSWAAGLETERKKWEKEYAEKVAEHKQQVEKWLKEAERRAEQKQLSEQATRDAKLLADQILHSGASPWIFQCLRTFRWRWISCRRLSGRMLSRRRCAGRSSGCSGRRRQLRPLSSSNHQHSQSEGRFWISSWTPTHSLSPWWNGIGGWSSSHLRGVGRCIRCGLEMILGECAAGAGG